MWVIVWNKRHIKGSMFPHIGSAMRVKEHPPYCLILAKIHNQRHDDAAANVAHEFVIFCFTPNIVVW